MPVDDKWPVETNQTLLNSKDSLSIMQDDSSVHGDWITSTCGNKDGRCSIIQAPDVQFLCSLALANRWACGSDRYIPHHLPRLCVSTAICGSKILVELCVFVSVRLPGPCTDFRQTGRDVGALPHKRAFYPLCVNVCFPSARGPEAALCPLWEHPVMWSSLASSLHFF